MGDETEIDSIPVKRAEFEFEQKYKKSRKIEKEIPCLLELKVTLAESEIWRDSKTIKQYYEHPRGDITAKNHNPDKKFS